MRAIQGFENHPCSGGEGVFCRVKTHEFMMIYVDLLRFPFLKYDHPHPRLMRGCTSACRVILARFRCDFGARRAQNDRKTCVRALRNLRKIAKIFARVRCRLAARLALRKRSFDVHVA